MCGIGACLFSDAPINIEQIASTIAARGPNGLHFHSDGQLHFVASVLHIQGDDMCSQPCVDEDGNVLLWNGELFDLDTNDLFDMPPIGCSDTTVVSDFIRQALSGSDAMVNLLRGLSSIHGPWAFVYYHRRTNRMIYGRDPFGRRSLLVLRRCSDQAIVALSSAAVPLPSELAEVSASDIAEDCTSAHIFYWEEISIEGVYSVHMLPPFSGMPSSELTLWPSHRIRLERRLKHSDPSIPALSPPLRAAEFLQLLRASVEKRVKRLVSGQSVGVLFSGGIDSVLLAALLHQCIENPDQPIELINVTFLDDSPQQSDSPDRLAAQAASVELRSLFPMRSWRLVHVDVAVAEKNERTSHIQNLILPRNTHMDLNIGTAFWFAARGQGYLREYCVSDLGLAYGALDNGQPLLRVGADTDENLKKFDRVLRLQCVNGNCRRISKRACISMFCSKCCYAHQRSVSSEVEKPCPAHKKKSEGGEKSEEKSAIASSESSSYTPYSSSCRVVLVGIGADEQMAGYGRHRTTFLRGGAVALEDELNMDLSRLWKRNLGRDDRCISDNGREPWFPFLDENVVSYLQNLGISEIADLAAAPGRGDKQILREAARLVGLKNCTELVKRAVQFGSRIAKRTSKKLLGSNRRGSGETEL